METQIDNEQKENRGLYWLITLGSGAACVALVMFYPAFFWVPLPFALTYFVKAIGMM